MKSPTSQTQTTSTHSFTDQLRKYKQQIDARISEYVKQSQVATEAAFGSFSADAYMAYTSILQRGGKRIRGALTMESYRMFGGEDEAVALQAAHLVMEMVQAYLLVIDDVCDRSPVRRGGPTAHMMLTSLHQQQSWRDDSGHFGMSVAVLAGVLGMHEALIEADKIGVGQATRLAAIRNLNYCLSVTAHGQFNDIFNQAAGNQESAAIEDVMVWKTAFYTFVNPLQFGAILANAPTESLQSLVAFSLQMGKAFQLSDDYIGVFVDEEVSGKSPLDDIKEGKHTLQVARALQMATGEDREYLASMLGNQFLTSDQLDECRRIIVSSGAKASVEAEMQSSLRRAEQYLSDIASHTDQRGRDFLQGLIRFLELRTS